MRTPFGKDWESVDLTTIQSFFVDAGDEGLTWEAKGTIITGRSVREGVGAFANSILGGYLVLGVSRVGHGPWKVDGWAPSDEPRTWVSNVVASGLEPQPFFDVKSWQLASGRWVAAVEVRPVPIPPCITSDGLVFERLPGRKSQHVSDSAGLRRLFDRGEAAERRARETSEAGRSSMEHAPAVGNLCQVIVSVASPSLAPDVSPLVFRQALRDAVKATVAQLRSPFSGQLPYIYDEASQHALKGWARGYDQGEGFAITVGRHGSVAAGYACPEPKFSGLRDAGSADSVLPGLWRSANALLHQLGAYGPTHAALRLRDPQRGDTHIARWTTVDGPSVEEIESVARESSRASGWWALEP
jgi:hypothetical protein